MTLLTEQNLNVPITLKVGSICEAVTVTAEAPVVDTADSRTHLTLENQAVAQLPMVGRNLVTLVTLAPGVSGLGTSATRKPRIGRGQFLHRRAGGCQRQRSGSEQQSIRHRWTRCHQRHSAGRVEPDPESGRHPGNQYPGQHLLQRVQPCRRAANHFHDQSGTDQFHGSAADYFNYQGMFADQHFDSPYQPFHTNNMSFAIGGPVIPHHQFFFYFAVEPLRSSQAPAVR